MIKPALDNLILERKSSNRLEDAKNLKKGIINSLDYMNILRFYSNGRLPNLNSILTPISRMREIIDGLNLKSRKKFEKVRKTWDS